MEIVSLVANYITESSKGVSPQAGLKPETVKQINAYMEQAKKFNFNKENIKASVDAIIAALEGKK